jgi:hypothetical protein
MQRMLKALRVEEDSRAQGLALLVTSFVLALENRDDPFHERAKSLASDFNREKRVLLLHWGILLEIGDGYARVERREKGCGLLEKLRKEEGVSSIVVGLRSGRHSAIAPTSAAFARLEYPIGSESQGNVG